MTNESIGKTLLPAVQTRSAIERLIQKGIIQGEAAQTWTEKRAELMAIDKEKRKVLANANKGHLSSMRIIGFCYRDGTHGFKKDQDKCVYWFQRGAEKDDPMCIVSLAVFYIHGNGVRRDPIREDRAHACRHARVGARGCLPGQPIREWRERSWQGRRRGHAGTSSRASARPRTRSRAFANGATSG